MEYWFTFTYLIVSGQSSLEDDILFSSLKCLINKTSMRCAITNSKFPRFLVHGSIWYLSSNVKVFFFGVICIFQFWIIIIWKFSCSINNFQNYNLISAETYKKKETVTLSLMHKLYHGIMENVNDLIPEDYNIDFARPAFVRGQKIRQSFFSRS